GSDPRIATCRGKLQNRRSKLNQEINKELRLRAGAENLFKATTNKKLKETVAVELSFVNSNLQLLKEQLAELNSSVELYQGESTNAVMPMIPLGLKETKEIDFRDPFKDFILEHYSEDANKYEDAIADFMDTRQAMRTPLRDSTGIGLLFRYYNQLYYVERRFFPPDRSLGIYFEWFDSLTGVPSCQRTVAFEKACVLFNMGAIYTQIGAKQDRSTAKGLDAAVDNFLRAAGTFRVNDLFRGLGPIAIFSAKRHWSAPRLVQLHRGRTNEGFGFSVRGDAPVIIAIVEPGSLAEFGGVKEGDFIVSIGDKDVKWASHEELVALIKTAGDSLSLKLVTPMDRTYLKSLKSNQSKGSVSTHSSSSGVSSGMSSPSGSMAQHNHNNSKRLIHWNPFKRNHSTSREGKDFFENVILR
ncbi:hypothetical protein D910_09773, partial [Dendroctonus ponderosae]